MATVRNKLKVWNVEKEVKILSIHLYQSTLYPVLIDDSMGRDVTSANAKFRMYSVIISGLRMSTDYSFDVWPVESGNREVHGSDTKLLHKSIVVSTRGFSARATQCLPHASEVEVATGPYFGGRIAVEAADGEHCAVDGDPDSPRDTYILRIDHKMCGTHVNETTVATFVLVQENLPILTHSTRRFLVLCTFQPETLTVRAGINLPSHHHREDPSNSNRVEHLQREVMPFETEVAESVNDVPVSHFQRHQQTVEAHMGRMLQDQSVVHFVLMITLMVGGVIGCILAAWWFIPGFRKRLPGRNMSPDDSSSVSIYENFENSLRDSSASDRIYEGSIHGGNEHCDIQAIIIPEQGESETECSESNDREDNNYSGVFTIRIPTHHLIGEEQPCIMIETNSHSEA
ncbi:hypothetical protein Cfor_11724 [Coptotermes formosanus]|uniref:ZP domain-containing protein n=1 Tax=Coptotermes formosanus TaxID=36987 RepID=A0A6L2PMX7_COPFO|nr:hypothetical protein Cfor_11724 [Coptotermes formosanus]